MDRFVVILIFLVSTLAVAGDGEIVLGELRESPSNSTALVAVDPVGIYFVEEQRCGDEVTYARSPWYRVSVSQSTPQELGFGHDTTLSLQRFFALQEAIQTKQNESVLPHLKATFLGRIYAMKAAVVGLITFSSFPMSRKQQKAHVLGRLKGITDLVSVENGYTVKSEIAEKTHLSSRMASGTSAIIDELQHSIEQFLIGRSINDPVIKSIKKGLGEVRAILANWDEDPTSVHMQTVVYFGDTSGPDSIDGFFEFIPNANGTLTPVVHIVSRTTTIE